MKKQIIILLLTVVGILNHAFAQHDTPISIIPYPVKLVKLKGAFIVDRHTQIICPHDDRFKAAVTELNRVLKSGFGDKLHQVRQSNRPSIVFHYDKSLLQAESYRVLINPNGILISAKNGEGAFRAVETIRQLLPAAIERGSAPIKNIRLPAVSIYDYPAYYWRGMHLDVARHFFSLAYLRKFIDVMALYKMNKLHLHLTDDQGWRIEIKRYPLLIAKGAWRPFNSQDSVCMERAKTDPDFRIDSSHIRIRNGETVYGGYYSQREMKQLVAYAQSKYIDIIPEIDMPGHMMSAINAYPYLTAGHGNKWGAVFSQPVCPCTDSTYQFVQNVFDEIMHVFPSKYIHIGGDEVDRSSWAKSPECAAFMKSHRITSLPGLQSFFINHMEHYFNDHGRKLIGWDEILEGGISPTALVMYWRTWVPSAPVTAVKNDNSVIMTPGTPLYFDHAADKNSIYDVYHFNLIPAGLTAGEAGHVIGAQANIWSEYIPSEKRADFMYMPRMTALAELLWTNRPLLYNSYLNRLSGQYPRLDFLHINYRLPDIPGYEENRVFITSDTLRAGQLPPGFVIRFTTDGSTPNQRSPVLTIYRVTNSCNIRLAVFTSSGRRGEVFATRYNREQLIPADPGANLQQGLHVAYYKGHYVSTTQIPVSHPDSSFTTSNIMVPSSVTSPSFGLRYSGFIAVPQDGIYTFHLTCDDGGVLSVSDMETVNNDGTHPAVEKSGQIALKKGNHNFMLRFIEAGGGFALKLSYSLNGSAFTRVPDAWFMHHQANDLSDNKSKSE